VQYGPSRYELRCFTPLDEVELCGHASLVLAHLIIEKLYPLIVEISFKTKSGILNASRKADLVELDFPVSLGEYVELPSGFKAVNGCLPYKFLHASKNITVLNSDMDIKSFTPDLDYIKGLGEGGLIITAQ
jgi:predicted PhzF superfamily epimerase YddE/YHI9